MLAAPGRADDNWPQFRGPTQQGHSTSTNLPVAWSESQNIKFKTAIPGQGWSSPVIWDDQVWMTTSLNEGRSLRAICVDKNSGKVVQDVEVFAIARPEEKNPFNSYASPTPVIEKGRVYVSFGTYGSACLDTATGQPIWKNQELKLAHKEGPGSSPIIYKDLFVLHCDGMDVQYIVALDKKTGKLAWKTNRTFDFERVNIRGDLRKAYCTPLIVNIDGSDQIISVASHRVYSYDPNTGSELWHFDIPGFSNAPLPIYSNGLLYINTGYMKAELWAIRTAGAAGDLGKTHIAWKFIQGVPLKPSLLLVNDEIYMVADNGIARCLNAKTGSLNWQSRIGATYSASPIYADGHVYFFDEKGLCTVVKPDRELKTVAENELESGCFATPAVSGKALFVRTAKHLYRIEK
jgi:outer membrane protein assembly factor BamB